MAFPPQLNKCARLTQSATALWLLQWLSCFSFASVESGKPIHVPRVGNHGNIHSFFFFKFHWFLVLCVFMIDLHFKKSNLLFVSKKKSIILNSNCQNWINWAEKKGYFVSNNLWYTANWQLCLCYVMMVVCIVSQYIYLVFMRLFFSTAVQCRKSRKDASRGK